MDALVAVGFRGRDVVFEAAWVLLKHGASHLLQTDDGRGDVGLEDLKILGLVYAVQPLRI